jgi:hypothetical protein
MPTEMSEAQKMIPGVALFPATGDEDVVTVDSKRGVLVGLESRILWWSEKTIEWMGSLRWTSRAMGAPFPIVGM